MNGQIIRYLALNGPSLIYPVKQDLASRSETKVHYPTVNRRMHELLRLQYVEKAGEKIIKAGIPAALYATRLRGDFAALAGILDNSGNYASELTPKEIRQMIAIASSRNGSPFVLLKYLLEQGHSGGELVEKELVPEMINGVRNGELNIDALDEGVMCSAFASLISRKVTKLMGVLGPSQSSRAKEIHQDQVEILTHSLDKMMSQSHSVSTMRKSNQKIIGESSIVLAQRSRLTPLSYQWANELKVFLRVHSVIHD